MKAPILTAIGNSLRFEWPELGIEARARRFTDRGTFTRCEVTWSLTGPSKNGSHLHSSLLSLNASSAKTQLAKTLNGRLSKFDWHTIVEQFCVLALERYRQGEPTTAIIADSLETQKPDYAIVPYLPRGQPFVIYGEPSCGKSYLALVLAIAAVTGKAISGLPFRPVGAYTPLYLDWEGTLSDQKLRLFRLQKGLGVSVDGKIQHRFCAATLSQDSERIQDLIGDLGANLLVIDSLGPAAGGDLNAPQVAQDFFSALRSLRCTSVILAHTSKHGDPRRRSIFGSMFFTALARGCAELRRFQEPGSDEVTVGFYHRKSNASRLERPFAMRFTFDGDNGPVTIQWTDIRKTPELSDGLSVSEQILSLLTDSGRLWPKEIGEALQIAGTTVRKDLKRLLAKDKVLKFDDGRYAAMTSEEESGVPF